MGPTSVFNFFTFLERILYKSNCIIFIFSWCGTHTKIGSKLVVIVTAGSQKITLWGPQRTPLGILRVKGALADMGAFRLGSKYESKLQSLQIGSVLWGETEQLPVGVCAFGQRFGWSGIATDSRHGRFGTAVSIVLRMLGRRRKLLPPELLNTLIGQTDPQFCCRFAVLPWIW